MYSNFKKWKASYINEFINMFSYSGPHSYLCYAIGIVASMLVQTASGERNR
jgi:hypothetical protein